MSDVGKFFDVLSGDYTATIERCFPRYREMLWALLSYLPESFQPETIVELGAGTGNLTVLLREQFPEATIHAVDLSGDSLTVCRQRTSGAEVLLTTHTADMANIEFPARSIDLVASSIAIHHLPSEAKQQLFARVHRWLRPGGVLTFADQFRGLADDVYAAHIENWRRLSASAGSDEQEWHMWMEHQREHDHHDPLGSHFAWLNEAGFHAVDCVWRYLLWAVVQGRVS